VAFTTRKIVTFIAWGLAFSSTSEMILVGAFGSAAGVKFGKGHSPDEVTASLTKAFSTWENVVPPIAGIIGLSLGLMGLLPGTEDK
jgi:hypothetical protein